VSKYTLVQGSPVPNKLAPFLRTILGESGAQLQSVYRGADAEDLLRRVGKHSQRQLYDGFRRGLPGYNPANPPGFSTHELRNDGAAYSQWPRGGKIPWWAVGIDIDDAHVKSFIAAAKRHGWVVSQTYPHSRGEYHHVNFRKPPVQKRVAANVQVVARLLARHINPSAWARKHPKEAKSLGISPKTGANSKLVALARRLKP